MVVTALQRKAASHCTRRCTALLLDGLALVAAERNNWACSATLFGAADSFRERIGSQPTGFETNRGEYIQAARSSLGERDFVIAWSAGYTMTFDQAIDYALGGETALA